MYRKIDNQFKEIGEIQLEILPSNFPNTIDYQVETYYEPYFEAGGDYYDVLAIDKRHTIFSIADVSGHGAPAMISMVNLRNFLHIYSSKDKSPNKALKTLNEMLYKYSIRNHFATMFCCLFDHVKKTICYSNAGHPPPTLYRKRTGSFDTLDSVGGIPLALYNEEVEYDEETIDIENGDVLFLYTDGFIEAFNNEEQMLGVQGIRDIIINSVRQNGKKLDYIITQYKKHLGTLKETDDTAFMLIEFTLK